MKIIAESAFNHNGSLEELKKLAIEAKKANADYFTVQVMHVDSFCVKEYEKYQLYKETEFTKEQWYEVFDFCKEIGIEVIPCVLEETSYKWCYNYGYRLIKLHATDITNEPFLKLISQSENISIILETQCATNFEIEFAINVLGVEKIEALFSGYSNYPTEVEDINLNVLDSFKNKYSLKTGFADHSLDTVNLPLMILAKGCAYIEKHITTSRNNRNFDYQVSLYPYEFSVMVNTIKHYSLALGNGIKHPVENEKKYRSIMYKKIVPSFGDGYLKRANEGSYFIEKEIENFDSKNIVVGLIARLKSKRLEKKVLKPFLNNELIIDLYNRIAKTEKYRAILATSNLPEDKPLSDLFKQKGLPFFNGDAVSVIDRLLSLAFKEKAKAIFRVTGDNPFTDPKLMEQMVDLLVENNLDYVKVNNVPFGIGAELFSTKYLWNLYLKLDTTEFSEYLTWYVLKDENVRMGSLDLELNNNEELVNFSVDYQADYDRCKKILDKIGKPDFTTITLKDIIENIEEMERVDDSKNIKLPEGDSISLKDYLKAFKEKKYVIRKKIKVI